MTAGVHDDDTAGADTAPDPTPLGDDATAAGAHDQVAASARSQAGHDRAAAEETLQSARARAAAIIAEAEARAAPRRQFVVRR
jgi:hypothetical protein